MRGLGRASPLSMSRLRRVYTTPCLFDAGPPLLCLRLASIPLLPPPAIPELRRPPGCRRCRAERAQRRRGDARLGASIPPVHESLASGLHDALLVRRWSASALPPLGF